MTTVNQRNYFYLTLHQIYLYSKVMSEIFINMATQYLYLIGLISWEISELWHENFTLNTYKAVEIFISRCLTIERAVKYFFTNDFNSYTSLKVIIYCCP